MCNHICAIIYKQSYRCNHICATIYVQPYIATHIRVQSQNTYWLSYMCTHICRIYMIHHICPVYMIAHIWMNICGRCLKHICVTIYGHSYVCDHIWLHVYDCSYMGIIHDHICAGIVIYCKCIVQYMTDRICLSSMIIYRQYMIIYLIIYVLTTWKQFFPMLFRARIWSHIWSCTYMTLICDHVYPWDVVRVKIHWVFVLNLKTSKNQYCTISKNVLFIQTV